MAARREASNRARCVERIRSCRRRGAGLFPNHLRLTMQIDSIAAPTQSQLDVLNAQNSAQGGQKTLGVNDFLKLLTVQLQSQDPLKPMEDTAFISQMASFTSLEQMRTL